MMSNTSRPFAAAIFRTLALGLLLMGSASMAAADTSTTDGSTPSNLTPGAPAGSYKLDGFGNVNLFNGNLDFHLPLSEVVGRGAARAPLALPIEMRWRTGMYTYTTSTGYPVTIIYATYNWWGSLPLGYGPGNIQGRSTSPEPSCGSTLFRLTFTAADGTEFELRDLQNQGMPGSTTIVPGPNGSQCVAQQSRGTVFVTADGSAATFISDVPLNDGMGIGGTPYKPSGYLLLRDGTRYRFDNALVSWVRDRNGNLITFGYDASGRVITATDSLNRQVTVAYGITQSRPYGQCDQPGYSCDEITYNGFGGAARTVRVTKTSLSNALRSGYSIQSTPTLFPEYSGSTTVNPIVTSAVWLPNGQAYKLYYNSYIELARVELPTGGAIEYDHSGGYSSGPQDGANGNQGIYRRVIESRTYAKSTDPNSLVSRTTFSRPESLSQSGGVSTVGYVEVDHKDEVGNLVSRERHYYYGNAATTTDNPACASYSQWQKGREYQTDWLGANGATLLRRVSRTWQQRATLSWWNSWNAQTNYQCTNYEPANDPRLVTTVMTLADTNQVTKESAVNPQTGAVGFDQYNNPTDVWEYDYGAGAPPAYAVRHTHTDYLTTNPANGIDYTAYTGAHIRSLPSAHRVYSVNPSNGAETLVSQITTSYDEGAYPLLAYGAVSGWADPGTAARGNATTTSRWLDTSNAWLSTHAQYDQVGNARNTWDANNNLTQFTYADSYSDGNNSRNTYAFPTGTTSPVPDPTGAFASSTALTTSSVYDYWTGHVTSTTDANNQATTAAYSDSLDRLTQVNHPDGGQTTYTYVDAHQCGPYVQALTLLDSSGRQANSYQFYDGLGRPVRAFTYENQDAANPWLTVDTQYDAMGRAFRVSNPYRSAGCTAAISPSGWTQMTFDALSRPTQVLTTADGAAVTTSYSGNTVTVTDQAGKQRSSMSDALGRLTQVTENPGGLNYVTIYTYDALGNLRMVNQSGQLRYFMYDSLGRLIRARNPEQAAGSVASNMTDSVTNNAQWSLAYGYDNDGNLTARVDARNIWTYYGYDALNRPTTVRYTDGTKDIDRHYDGAINGRGRFYYFNWDPSNNTRFDTHLAVDQYDAVGRVVKYRQHFLTNGAASPQFLLTRSYDYAGHIASETYPSGHTVSYSYDIAGRTSGFSGNLGDGVSRTYSTGVSYSEFGGLQQEQFGTLTPLYHKLRYNVRGQLYDVRLSTLSLQAGETDWNRGCLAFYYGGYAWGQSGPANNGDMTLEQHWAPADDSYSNYWYTQDSYGYDSLNRLTSASEVHGGPWGQSGQDYVQAYNYDQWGNRRISSGSTIYATQYELDAANSSYREVPAPSNRLYAPGDGGRWPGQKLMNYDAAGNLIYDGYQGQGTRVYDAESRISQAQDVYQNWSTYTYDADGRRVKRANVYGETWQIYGPGGELLAEYPAGAAPFLAAKEYGYRGGELLVTMSSGDVQRLQRFVKNLYYNCLGRDATSAELQQQTDALAQAGAQGGESQLLTTARSIARSLFESSEYAGRGRTDSQYVTDLYNAYLQRGPDSGGLNFWVQNTQANGRGATLNAFEVSTEFATLSSTVYGTASGGDNQRVDHFVEEFYYGAYQRAPTSAETQQQEARLNNAASVSQAQVVSEAQAMGHDIFVATNYNSGSSDQDYVTALYEAFLQRAPDGPGLGFWVSNTQANGRAATLAAFQASTEYQALAGTLYRETFWLVGDQSGTPRMVVYKTGALAGVKRHDYLPFGEELGANVGGRATTQGYSAVDNVRQKFDGYERDAETNLDYAQARYYASAAGRFTSVDPLAASARLTNPQSFNRYSYALNNPLRYTDPSGMDTDDCDYNNYLLGEEMSDELNQAAQQQQSQQQPQPEPTPVATQSATIANAPTSGAGQLPVTVVVDQMNNPGVRVRDIKGNEALVVGVDLRFTFLDEKGNPVTNATVSEEVVDSTGKKVTQSDKPTPLDAKGQGADLVSNPSGPVPKPDDRKAQMDAIDHFNADFTTEQTLKLTVTTSTGSVVQVTQKRTLTNMTPGASKIAGGLIRGYTFTMEKPKIEKIK